MADTSAPQDRGSIADLLDRQFALTANGTSVRTEFVAGLTTFLTMVYIVFVNSDILSNAGMDRGAVFVATCLAAAISTVIMAFYANSSIALALGTGLNAFFAFTLVIGYKYAWAAGTRWPRLGNHHRIRPRRRDRDRYAADLFDRDRAWLRHLCVMQMFSGRLAEAKPAVVILAGLFAIKFAVAG